MANKRVFYACQKAGISPAHTTAVNFTTLRGLQSIGVTTTFNLEQVFEFGQLAIYENIEGIPNVEVTLEKVLDGYCPAYILATAEDKNGTSRPNTTLAGRANGYCILGLSIFDETQVLATGAAGTEVHMSGLYVSSVRYQVAVDGNATENLTLVGNNKVWVVGGDTGNWQGRYYTTAAQWDTAWNPASTGTLAPKSIASSGGVNRRQDVLFGTGTGVSKLPTMIPGIDASGWNKKDVAGDYGAHIRNISISTNLGRDQLFELGRYGNFDRYINWPVEVTTEIGVISGSGDLVSAIEDGLYGSNAGCGGRYNLKDEAIVLHLCEGLKVDCGSKNKLASVGMTGGNTGKGNQEITYTFNNFNEMDVSHPSDPVV